jgi:putative spermidine/putrescine transport system permease protein
MLDAFENRGLKLCLWIFAALVLFFLILPTLIVVPLSFSASDLLEFPPRALSLRWYESFFGSVAWMAALRTSLILGVMTALIAVPVSLLACLAMNRVGGFASRAVYTYVLSPSVVTIILLLPAVSRFDWTQISAARSLGAGWGRALCQIMLPQLRFTLMTAALMAFLASLDEAVISIFVSSGENSTLPKLMFLSLRDQIDPTIAAISTLWTLLVISIVLILNARQKG